MRSTRALLRRPHWVVLVGLCDALLSAACMDDFSRFKFAEPAAPHARDAGVGTATPSQRSELANTAPNQLGQVAGGAAAAAANPGNRSHSARAAGAELDAGAPRRQGTRSPQRDPEPSEAAQELDSEDAGSSTR